MACRTGQPGSVIRTAAWFGLGRLLLLGASADVGSIKVLRASMGAVFRLDSVVRAEHDTLARPAEGGRWIGLDAGGDACLSDFRFRPGDVIVLGGESHGLDASRPFLDLDAFDSRGRPGGKPECRSRLCRRGLGTVPPGPE
jgi:tRNA(Leu) C34 or U34 (ribose-2'-O)-methylase TrmL